MPRLRGSTDEALMTIAEARLAARDGDWTNPHPVGTRDHRWYAEGLRQARERVAEQRRQKAAE